MKLFDRRSARLALALIALLALQGLFLASNLLSAVLPRGPIEAHLAQSAGSALLTREGTYRHSVLGGLMSYDNNRYLGEVARQKIYPNPVETAVRTTIEDRASGDPAVPLSRTDYFRYWHGWQLISNLSFLVGPIWVLQTVAAILSLGSAALLAWELSRRWGLGPALAFVLIAYFGTLIGLNFLGDLTLSIAASMTSLMAAAVLRVGRWLAGSGRTEGSAAADRSAAGETIAGSVDRGAAVDPVAVASLTVAGSADRSAAAGRPVTAASAAPAGLTALAATSTVATRRISQFQPAQSLPARPDDWASRVGLRSHRTYAVGLTVLLAGAVCCFFDFLTLPGFFVTLLTVCGLLACEGRAADSQTKTKTATKTALRTRLLRLFGFAALFTLGYAASWLGKWGLMMFFEAPATVIHNVIAEMTTWSNGSDASSFQIFPSPRWPHLIQALYRLSPRLFALVAPFGVAVSKNLTMLLALLILLALLLVLAVTGLRRRRQSSLSAPSPAPNAPSTSHSFSLRDVWQLSLPLLLVPLVSVVLSMHTVWHLYIFSYKNWAIVLALPIALLLRYLTARPLALSQSLKPLEQRV